MTGKWNIANNQSNANYSVENKIIYNIQVLKSYLCHYHDAYILVKGDITVIVVHLTQVRFKTCAPFTKCITEIDGTTVDDAEGLDLVLRMYNLLEYSWVILTRHVLIVLV